MGELARPAGTEAVALFCYQVKKGIGAFAAALGGLDTLVFAGGIGKNSPVVRARICAGRGFFGIELEEKRDAPNEGVISAETSGVTALRLLLRRAPYELGALGAELGALQVDTFDGVGGAHHAGIIRAMAQAVGVAQFVEGLFQQAFVEESVVSRHAVDLLVLSMGRDGRSAIR